MNRSFTGTRAPCSRSSAFNRGAGLPPGWRLASSLALLAVGALATAPQAADGPPAGASREALAAHLNDTSRRFTEERARAVAAITTRAQAEQRQAAAREQVLRLIGGLPDTRGPLAVRSFGTLQREGFSVERIVYDSLPDLHVTANVYVPASGQGPFPAIVLSPGHSVAGKGEFYETGANLARRGFVAIAWDPIGQGERLQHYDPDLGASKVGRPTGEHGHASVQTMLIGDHVSRYFVWDAMRAIDYLETRGDVDPTRIGAYGCSGGGAVTAFLTALDPRVQAAATACYVTTFDALLPTAGPQEAEQTIPRFLSEGLDLGDWVLMAAPRPYAIVSTTEDFFPFDGARTAYEEAQRFYGLFGARDRLRWITGPGGHGALGSLMPDIVGFFVKAFQGTEERPVFDRVRQERPDDLLCTKTGQIATSLGGETIQSLNRKRAATLMSAGVTVDGQADLQRLQARLRTEIVALTGVPGQPGAAAPEVRLVETVEREKYRLVTVGMPTSDGLVLPVTLAKPKGDGRRKVLVTLSAEPVQSLGAPGRDLDRLASGGTIVVVVPPRPFPAGTEEEKSPLLGPAYLLSLRPLLVGGTLLGMRTADVITAVDWLCQQADVDRSAITVHGTGTAGPVALHAAALDPRIGAVITEAAPLSLRAIVEQPVHRGSPEVVVPGMLRKYDLPDLITAIAPRRVTVINPVDAVGNPVREEPARAALASVFASDGGLGSRGRVRVLWRGLREPLPVP